MATVTRFPQNQGEPVYDPGQMPPPDDSREMLDPRRLLGALRRRKVLIAGIMLVVTGLAVLFVGQITPLYQASATLVVGAPRTNVMNFESAAQNLTTDYYTNETEAAILGSRELATKAVDRLNLYEHPLFNPEMQKPKASLIGLLTKAIKRRLGGAAEPEPQDAAQSPWAGFTPQEKRAAMREYLTDAYLGGLGVLPSERSRVLIVQYVSTDPEFAALAANTTAEMYIADQVASKGEATSRASAWLNERVRDLRERVIESDRKLEEFRRKSGIVEVGGTSVIKERATKLNAELFEASSKRQEAEARLQQIKKLINDTGGLETAAAVLDSPLIQRLREQETQIARKIAELQTQLRDGHPRMALARNELADLQEKIAAEVSKIASNLENETEIARIREANLQKQVAQLQQQLEQQNDAEVTLRALMTEAQANKQLYETVLARFKESDVVDEELQQADARIISRAVVPSGPFYPQKRLMIMAALVASGLLGMTLALVLEFLDSGFRSVSQVEAVTGLPVLATLPSLDRSERDLRPFQAAIRKPNSAFGEAIRSLRTALLLSDAERPPKTVLVTSSVSGEGKTSASVAIAALAARSGQRAIVIDCDLRHADVHQVLKQPNELGMADYLTGQATLDQVIEIDPESGVHYVTAGNRAPHPADLLASQQMRQFVNLLSTMYDLVVLDTPPILAVSDALVLVRYVDKSIYLVRWERTRRDTAVAGLKQMADSGAALAGLVLSQVDLKKQARYGYASSGYYDYHRSSKYYAE